MASSPSAGGGGGGGGSSPAESFASQDARVWGPAVSIVALVAANLVALLLNPGLFRSCCFRRAPRKGADLAPAPAPPPPARPPKRTRCWPIPFFASNLNEDAARRARPVHPDLPRPAHPLPREFWGFDVLSPRDPLSSYLQPRSVRPTGAALPQDAIEEPPPWSPATWVLLPLFLLVFGYFVAYVLLETLWRESKAKRIATPRDDLRRAGANAPPPKNKPNSRAPKTPHNHPTQASHARARRTTPTPSGSRI